MRLHAVIMALKSGVPVAGISYDPKVKMVVQEFEQPYLDLRLNQYEKTEATVNQLLENTGALAQKAKRISGDKEKSARQNKQLLAKFLK